MHDPNQHYPPPSRQQQQQPQLQRHAQAAAQPSHLPSSSRIPDSPPISDVSAEGGSPSSSNRSIYSPDYGNFSAIDNNNGGLVLAVNDLANEDDRQMMRPQQMSQDPFMHSPYPIPPNQMSPPEITKYSQQMNFGNVYAEPQNSGSVRGAKRARAVYSQQHPMHEKQSMYDDAVDISRVKPDPAMMNYPSQPVSRFIPPNTPGLMSESPMGSDVYLEEEARGFTPCRVLRFSQFYPETWHKLYDDNHQPLHFQLSSIIADKGFSYSTKDGIFINQKKNHFQVTATTDALDDRPPSYVLVNGMFVPFASMQLSICGVKAEEHSTKVKVKQSDKDRKTANTKPVELGVIPPSHSTTTTVRRLHFEECTLNNQLKNGKISPDQRFFLLTVRLMAKTVDGAEYPVAAYASDPFVVRAGNPKQFEAPVPQAYWEVDYEIMYTSLRVSIGTKDNYGAALNVNGDIVVTGQIRQFSDGRLKENVVTLDGKKAMENHNRLRIVEYDYKKEYARAMGLSDHAIHRVGVIAQEVREVHPESVNPNGEFLTVDPNRMFYENIAVVQELSKMHKNLENKMNERVYHMQSFFRKIFRPKESAETVSADSGLEDTQSLSASRYTLVSAFKRENMPEPCHHPTCSRSEPSASCTTKLTQGTIITLVIVMAVCLLSMSALYVVDWHHRNYGIHSIDGKNRTGIEEVPKGDGGLGMMKKTITMPHHQPGAPPLHDMCLHSGCRSFCCEKKASYSTETRQGGFDIDTMIPLSGSRRAFLAAIAGAQRMNPNAFFRKPLATGTRFEIVGKNMTIDSRYCTERSCNEKKGRYHLFVPISPYMPTTPVMLRVVPPPGMFVQSCGHMLDFEEEECSSEGGSPHFTLSMPTATEVGRDLFEISAGNYKRSGYRFRVGTNTESCYGSEERFRSSYEEYNIIFYRTCGDENDSIPTTIEIESDRDFGMPGAKHSHDSRRNTTAA